MNGFVSNVVAKIATNKTSRAFTGWGSWLLSSWLFDGILYPVVIGWLGLIVGGGIMASIAIIWSWYWLKGVVSSEKEWFNMKVVHKIQRIVFWVVRITKHIPFVKKSWVDKVEFALTLIAISCLFDPMIATLYFRHGDTAKTLSKKDKKIFAWSALVSNTYWILRSWGVASLVIYGWKSIMR